MIESKHSNFQGLRQKQDNLSKIKRSSLVFNHVNKAVVIDKKKLRDDAQVLIRVAELIEILKILTSL